MTLSTFKSSWSLGDSWNILALMILVTFTVRKANVCIGVTKWHSTLRSSTTRIVFTEFAFAIVDGCILSVHYEYDTQTMAVFLVKVP